ncbi:unnamed protein product [Gordionus sp. m RMFG-2023]
MYVYLLGPLLFLGIIGNIFYFLFSSKIKYNKNILHNKDESIYRNTNITISRLDKDDIIMPKTTSKQLQTHSKEHISLRPSNNSMNASTAHFYIIIYTILLWDVIACINFIFFPFLYYSNRDLGISNKIFMIYSTRATFFVEQVCATNLNWNTTILSLSRFMAIYFPHRFANLTTQNRFKNEGKTEPSQKYRMRNNAYLKYIRQFFGHLFMIKKTKKSALILMASICLFSIFISMPYLFYVDVKEGVRNKNSQLNTTVILSQVTCDSKRLKNPIIFSYYFVMSKFYDSFSTHYDKFFSILVYFIPTLLIMFSHIFVFAKLKKLKRTVNVKSHGSDISTNIESNLTVVNQKIRPSHLSPNDRINKVFNNKTNPKFITLPAQTTPSIRSYPKNDQNSKTTKSAKFYLDKYVLTLAIGIEFLLLNLPYVIYVFMTSQSWVEGASSKFARIQIIVNFLKYSNHSINVYINIIFNSTIRTVLMFQLNKFYISYITRTGLTSTNES